jgi:glycosyltransferase involved in cell wall biosynthesis
MEAGLPVICTDYSLWKDIIDRYDCGICVKPGSVDEIRSAIEYIVSDRARAFRMGQNGRRAVLEEFNWSSEERKYLDVFKRIQRKGRAA